MRGKLTASIQRVREAGLCAVVSEIKPRSPKEGELLQGRDPVGLARRMARCPIAGLSVVTEPEHFGGSLQMLEHVAQAVTLPILQKDFFSAPAELDSAKLLGASAVLFSVSLLDDDTLRRLNAHARDIGLETALEIHSKGDLERLEGMPMDILGVNNRDIAMLEMDDADVTVTESLASLAKRDVLTLSESSLKGPEDVRRAYRAGADCVLIGTAVLRAADLEGFLNSLIHAQS